MEPSDIIRAEITALSAYQVQHSAGLIKLDAMENPYSFPSSLQDALLARLSTASLNRYPSADAPELKAAIRRAMNIPNELDILLGNGSDEIIQIIAMALAKPGAALLSVEPAFVMFKMIAIFCGMKYVGVPLTADFEIDVEAMLAAIQRDQPVVTFIAYPNNPTGNLFSRDAIARIISACEKHHGLVVVDEAYFAFSSESLLHEVRHYPNVVLMRTVSKLGLAGARLGVLIGDRRWLQEFNKLRLPYNINILTQTAVTFAMEHYTALQDQARLITDERARLAAALSAIPGIHVFPSQANFLLIRVADAARVFSTFVSRKILVKNPSQSHALLSNTLRLTIGSPDENDAMISALQATPGI